MERLPQCSGEELASSRREVIAWWRSYVGAGVVTCYCRFGRSKAGIDFEKPIAISSELLSAVFSPGDRGYSP